MSRISSASREWGAWSIASSMTVWTALSACRNRRRAGVGNHRGARTGRTGRLVFHFSIVRIGGPSSSARSPRFRPSTDWPRTCNVMRRIAASRSTVPAAARVGRRRLGCLGHVPGVRPDLLLGEDRLDGPPTGIPSLMGQVEQVVAERPVLDVNDHLLVERPVRRSEHVVAPCGDVTTAKTGAIRPGPNRTMVTGPPASRNLPGPDVELAAPPSSRSRSGMGTSGASGKLTHRRLIREWSCRSPTRWVLPPVDPMSHDHDEGYIAPLGQSVAAATCPGSAGRAARRTREGLPWRPRRRRPQHPRRRRPSSSRPRACPRSRGSS